MIASGSATLFDLGVMRTCLCDSGTRERACPHKLIKGHHSMQEGLAKGMAGDTHMLAGLLAVATDLEKGFHPSAVGDDGGEEIGLL